MTSPSGPFVTTWVTLIWWCSASQPAELVARRDLVGQRVDPVEAEVADHGSVVCPIMSRLRRCPSPRRGDRGVGVRRLDRGRHARADLGPPDRRADRLVLGRAGPGGSTAAARRRLRRAGARRPVHREGRGVVGRAPLRRAARAVVGRQRGIRGRARRRRRRARARLRRPDAHGLRSRVVRVRRHRRRSNRPATVPASSSATNSAASCTVRSRWQSEPSIELTEIPAHRWHRWVGRRDDVSPTLGPLVLPEAVAHTGVRAPFAFPDGTTSDLVLSPRGWQPTSSLSRAPAGRDPDGVGRGVPDAGPASRSVRCRGAIDASMASFSESSSMPSYASSGAARTALSSATASSPTRIRQRSSRTPCRITVAASAADIGALSRNMTLTASISCFISGSSSVADAVAHGVLHDRRADVAGHHDRTLDVRCVDAQVGDQRLGEALHGELRRRVRRVRPLRTHARPEPVDARGVDDVALVGGDEQREEGAGAVVHAAPAHGEAPVPRLAAVGEQAAAAAQAGVVEQQVDVVGLVLLDHLVAEREDRLLRRDVAQVRGDADVRRRFLGHRPGLVELVGRQVARGDVASGLDQLQHQLAPHPARAARDDRNFSLEVLHASGSWHSVPGRSSCRGWRGCDNRAMARDILDEFAAEQRRKPSYPDVVGRDRHGRRRPGEPLLRRHRALERRSGHAARARRPPPPLRLEARRVPDRRRAGHARAAGDVGDGHAAGHGVGIGRRRRARPSRPGEPDLGRGHPRRRTDRARLGRRPPRARPRRRTAARRRRPRRGGRRVRPDPRSPDRRAARPPRARFEGDPDRAVGPRPERADHRPPVRRRVGRHPAEGARA